jgi:molybdopterin biosynthesis enzyme
MLSLWGRTINTARYGQNGRFAGEDFQTHHVIMSAIQPYHLMALGSVYVAESKCYPNCRSDYTLLT